MLYDVFWMLSVFSFCDGYKVLVFFPVPGKSHAILGEGYVKHLLEAGHDVTYITPLPMKEKHTRLRQIEIPEAKGIVPFEIFNVQTLMKKDFDILDYKGVIPVFNDFMNGVLNMKAVQNLINDSSENFDAVVVEWMYNELGSGFATVFNCPLIWSSSMVPHTFVLSLIDDPPNPAYTFHLHSINYSFTLLERIRQLWTILDAEFYRWKTRDKVLKIYQNAYGPAVMKRGRQLPSYDEARFNGSLMLGNADVCTGDSIAIPKNYKDIGGYHIPNDVEALPKEFENIMDNAKHGVIYFSLGTLLSTGTISNEFLKRFVDMLGGLQQTIIWKLDKVLEDLPKNVHIVTWAPQQSILAHPNCVLFISHGGLLSTTEAIHFGVPIIGMPFFADQFNNLNRAVLKGFVLRIDFDDNTPDNLKVALHEILENPSYSQRMKEISAIYHNRIIPPGKELVHWIEYVIKTRGAPHLRSVAHQVEWYKKMFLDLALVILAVAIICIAACRRSISLLKRICGTKKKTA